jgi:hypothetical protein
MLSKEIIQNLLATDDRAIARALLVLNERQTADEQAQEGTRWLNGMGFRPCHARMGTSMAKFFKRNGYLTPNQISYWRVKDRTGNTRIEIYWKQLQEAAAMKKAKIDVVVLAPTDGHRDYGNDMERLMALKEEFGMCLDSDDDKILDPIKKEIDEIEAYWKGKTP